MIPKVDDRAVLDLSSLPVHGKLMMQLTEPMAEWD